MVIITSKRHDGHFNCHPKGCLKKKVHMSQPLFTPFKSSEQNRKDIFLPLDPPPPFKTRGICYTFFCFLKIALFCSHHHIYSQIGKNIISFKDFP